VDLSLIGRALWRFRYLVFIGVILAVGLTFLATFRVGPHGKLSYRQNEQWASYSQIVVTERGFPWGSLKAPAASSPDRFASLALLFANFANTDPVRALMRKMGTPIYGSRVEVLPVFACNGCTDTLPFVKVAGIAPTREQSLIVTDRATRALLAYIHQEQAANAIPDSDRVSVQLIQSPGQSGVLTGRSKTVPIMVFVAVLTLMMAIVLTLDNIRPRVRPVKSESQQDSSDLADARRKLLA
jgi:hypothetical protein